MFDFLKKFKKSKVQYQVIAEDKKTKIIKEASDIVYSGVSALAIAKAYYREFGETCQVLGIRWAYGQEWIQPITSDVLNMEV